MFLICFLILFIFLNAVDCNLELLHCSAEELVYNIRDSLTLYLNRSDLSVYNYKFKHNNHGKELTNHKRIKEYTKKLQTCNATYTLPSCDNLILRQISLSYKRLPEFIISLLRGNLMKEIPTKAGVSSLIYEAIALSGDKSYIGRIEAGGGSGFGFQIYCNGRFILTAGAGSGGGIEGDIPCNARHGRMLSSSHSFGGGGGGGVQISVESICEGDSDNDDGFALGHLPEPVYNSQSNTISIGGGGGCGIEHSANNTGYYVDCALDADADFDYTTLAPWLDRVRNKLATCTEVSSNDATVVLSCSTILYF